MRVPAVIACVRACVAQPLSSHPLGAMPPIRPLNRQGLSYCDNGLLYETTGLNGVGRGGREGARGRTGEEDEEERDRRERRRRREEEEEERERRQLRTLVVS